MANTKRDRLTWRGNGLYAGNRRLSAIEPDPDWPNMWRVVEADGSLSDMVNLTRAKDAATLRAIRILNTGSDAAGGTQDRAE